jgi:hypothetical protein
LVMHMDDGSAMGLWRRNCDIAVAVADC